jgi:hypothetical protein
MPLETGTTIADLTAANPAATDGLGQADDHIRLIKTVLKTTFPNFVGVLSATEAEIDASLALTQGIPWDTAQIADDAVTYAKIQNVSATDMVLGRATAGAGDVEEIACTAAGRALLGDANAAAQRTTLGLATVAATGAYSDLSGKPTLGTAAALDVGTGASQVVQLNGSAQLPAVSGVNLTAIPWGSITNRDMVRLAVNTVSGAAQSDFTLDTANYRTFVFEFYDIVAASGTPTFGMRIGTGGGPTFDTASNYFYTYAAFGGGAVSNATGTIGYWAITPLTATTGQGASGTITLFDAGSGANYKYLQYQAHNATTGLIGSGRYNSATALTAVRFLPSTAVNFSGSIVMYGLR